MVHELGLPVQDMLDRDSLAAVEQEEEEQ